MRFQDVRIGFLVGSLFLFAGNALAETVVVNSSADETVGGARGVQPTLGDVTNNGAFIAIRSMCRRSVAWSRSFR
jgi:hypothetical protein